MIPRRSQFQNALRCYKCQGICVHHKETQLLGAKSADREGSYGHYCLAELPSGQCSTRFHTLQPKTFTKVDQRKLPYPNGHRKKCGGKKKGSYIIQMFSMSMSLFLFHRQVHLRRILDSTPMWYHMLFDRTL